MTKPRPNSHPWKKAFIKAIAKKYGTTTPPESRKTGKAVSGDERQWRSDSTPRVRETNRS
jgi:lambda repressor-like predicted transcriptional regulator